MIHFQLGNYEYEKVFSDSLKHANIISEFKDDEKARRHYNSFKTKWINFNQNPNQFFGSLYSIEQMGNVLGYFNMLDISQQRIVDDFTHQN